MKNLILLLVALFSFTLLVGCDCPPWRDRDKGISPFVDQVEEPAEPTPDSQP